MKEITPHTIELLIGYTDKQKVTHRRVTFGCLLTGKQLFFIDDDPLSNIPTQAEDLILRAAIVEFGSLRMPVILPALLNLDSLDRDDLNEGYAEFTRINQDDAKPEFLSNNLMRLAIGYESNGLVYDMVEFGNRITGMDEVEADRLKLKGVRRACFLAGKQVTKLTQSDGQSELPGPIGLNIFESLYAVDLQALQVGGEIFRQSFRRVGAHLSANRRS